MPLTAILSPRAVRLSYSELVKQLKRGAIRVPKTEVWWGGGSTIADVYWREDHKFWLLPSGTGDVYPHRVRLGLKKPVQGQDVRLIAMFNFAGGRVGRRGGLFATDDDSLDQCLLHSGAIGGGIPGVNRSEFLKYCHSRRFNTVTIAGEPSVRAVRIGHLHADNLAASVGSFVRLVENFKQKASKAAGIDRPAA